MFDHSDLEALHDASLRMQGHIRKQTLSPEHEKTLPRFSSWEVAELIFQVNQNTFLSRLAADPSLCPQATLSHSMGLSDVSQEHTAWGIMARDLMRETWRRARSTFDAASAAFKTHALAAWDNLEETP